MGAICLPSHAAYWASSVRHKHRPKHWRCPFGRNDAVAPHSVLPGFTRVDRSRACCNRGSANRAQDAGVVRVGLAWICSMQPRGLLHRDNVETAQGQLREVRVDGPRIHRCQSYCAAFGDCVPGSVDASVLDAVSPGFAHSCCGCQSDADSCPCRGPCALHPGALAF